MLPWVSCTYYTFWNMMILLNYFKIQPFSKKGFRIYWHGGHFAWSVEWFWWATFYAERIIWNWAKLFRRAILVKKGQYKYGDYLYEIILNIHRLDDQEKKMPFFQKRYVVSAILVEGNMGNILWHLTCGLKYVILFFFYFWQYQPFCWLELTAWAISVDSWTRKANV